MHISMLNKFKWGMVKECDEILTDLDIPADVMICRPGAVILIFPKYPMLLCTRYLYCQSICLVKEGAYPKSVASLRYLYGSFECTVTSLVQGDAGKHPKFDDLGSTAQCRAGIGK